MRESPSGWWLRGTAVRTDGSNPSRSATNLVSETTKELDLRRAGFGRDFRPLSAVRFRDRRQSADSDEAGHAFRKEAGHRFRSEAGRDSDLKPATQRSLPRIGAMMLRRDGSVKRAPILGLRSPRRMVGC